MLAALAAGTPWAVGPAYVARGSTDASPTFTSTKNEPIDSTIPLFMNVARIRHPRPSGRGG